VCDAGVDERDLEVALLAEARGRSRARRPDVLDAQLVKARLELLAGLAAADDEHAHPAREQSCPEGVDQFVGVYGLRHHPFAGQRLVAGEDRDDDDRGPAQVRVGAQLA
jgi:hypothetical protein